MVKILFFGITSDLIGSSEVNFKIEPKTSVKDFKIALLSKFEKLNSLSSFAVAVNEQYANEDMILSNNDIVAIIPPVSGG